MLSPVSSRVSPPALIPSGGSYVTFASDPPYPVKAPQERTTRDSLSAGLKTPSAQADRRLQRRGRVMGSRRTPDSLPGAIGNGMKIRALLLIVLTTGWLLPAGASACPAEGSAKDDQKHTAHVGDHARDHGDHAADGHGHDHASGSGGQREAGGPPAARTCCRDDAEAPVIVASLLDAKPQPQPIAHALENPVETPPAAAVSSGTWLRVRQPPPLPFARSRRPLLI